MCLSRQKRMRVLGFTSFLRFLCLLCVLVMAVPPCSWLSFLAAGGENEGCLWQGAGR
jgi:hypothetical protein